MGLLILPTDGSTTRVSIPPLFHSMRLKRKDSSQAIKKKMKVPSGNAGVSRGVHEPYWRMLCVATQQTCGGISTCAKERGNGVSLMLCDSWGLPSLLFIFFSLFYFPLSIVPLIRCFSGARRRRVVNSFGEGVSS